MFQIPLKQKNRLIMHIDADAFFASVEQAINPRLRGKAVIVGGVKTNNGIVSACSYEARKFGISSGMPIFQARKLCPHAIFTKTNFSAYKIFSAKMFEIFKNFTLNVEPVSIDEAFLDITDSINFFNDSREDVAKKIMNEIEKSLNITVSIGLATNKTVAKIASSINKPNKLTVVPYGAESKFLAPLSLNVMPGIGTKTFRLLTNCGLSYLGDFASLPLAQVVQNFGVNAVKLWKRSKGFDNDPVDSFIAKAKSISREYTFYESVRDLKLYHKFLKILSRDVCSQLRIDDQQAGTVFLKLRYKIKNSVSTVFRDFTFQKNLSFRSSADSDLFPVMKDLFEKNLSPHFPLRLVGVGVCNLVDNYNLTLFAQNKNSLNLFKKIDTIQRLYGEKSLRYGI